MSWVPKLRRFHRWHGLLVSVIVFTSAGSGLMHTWMARAQAPPPPTRPTAALAVGKVILPPSEMCTKAGIDPAQVRSVSLRPIADEPWYQVITADRPMPIYVHGGDGRVDDQADARYAAEIASAAAGGQAVQQTNYLTAFDQEYITIFRILPVYRFEVADGQGTRLYVSTMTGSVTRATNDEKQREAWIFTYLHKWNFIANRTIRDWAFMLAMSAIMALAVSGIVLFWMTRKRSP